jgi:peptidoglycan/LPS O-acetylase OafA/YrhL
MKKTILLFVIAILVLGTVGLWIYSSKNAFSPGNIFQLGVIVIVVGFALFFGIKRAGSTMRGEPAEDELSRKMLVKASSISFYISIYLWLIVMYFSDKTKLATHTLIGAGILGMALLFALCWVVIYLRGIRNE